MNKDRKFQPQRLYTFLPGPMDTCLAVNPTTSFFQHLSPPRWIYKHKEQSGLDGGISSSFRSGYCSGSIHDNYHGLIAAVI